MKAISLLGANWDCGRPAADVERGSLQEKPAAWFTG